MDEYAEGDNMRIMGPLFNVSFLLCLSMNLYATENIGEVVTEKTISPKEMSSRFEQLELFNKVLYMVETQYYRDIDMNKLIQGAIKGMMDTLDPHSGVLIEDMFTKIQNDTSGEFGGLGIEVAQKDGAIYVVTVLDETPAFNAGLKSGDQIIEIDHRPTMGMTLEEAVKLMLGEVGTKLQLGVNREGGSSGDTIYINLVRKIIKVRPVKYQLVDKNYAFIRLSSFQKNSGVVIREAIQNMRKEIKAAKTDEDIKGIILDLRSNPGGLLDEAVEVASIFLKDGIVVSTEGRNLEQKEVKSVVNNGPKELETPLVVLINGASASASEIVAGALQDHKRAIIMGSQSFGKGSVQSVAKIDEKNGLKLTIAQYLTPLKRKIQAIGIIPDVAIDEVDAQWTEEHTGESRYIREVDLFNHLNATIETAEEKKHRELREQKEREKRALLIESRAKNRKEEKKSKKYKERDESFIAVKYDPKKDYQVTQAINFLKSFDIFKSFTH